MIKSTLATLGYYLAQSFELQKSQVAFTEKDSIFKSLSEKSLPFDLPALTYYCSEFVFENFPRGKARVNSTVNNTEALCVIPSPIKLEISFAFITSTLDDYFNMINRFMEFKYNKSELDVTYIFPDGMSETLSLSISNFQNLSTPPTGKDGNDYDRGVFYVLESSFTVNSFVFLTESHKLIRDVKTQVDWTIQPDKFGRLQTDTQSFTQKNRSVPTIGD